MACWKVVEQVEVQVVLHLVWGRRWSRLSHVVVNWWGRWCHIFVVGGVAGDGAG